MTATLLLALSILYVSFISHSLHHKAHHSLFRFGWVYNAPPEREREQLTASRISVIIAEFSRNSIPMWFWARHEAGFHASRGLIEVRFFIQKKNVCEWCECVCLAAFCVSEMTTLDYVWVLSESCKISKVHSGTSFRSSWRWLGKRRDRRQTERRDCVMLGGDEAIA